MLELTGQRGQAARPRGRGRGRACDDAPVQSGTAGLPRRRGDGRAGGAGPHRRNPPDLVLLDWMLPVMSGIDVCRQIRRGSTTRDLPVIMVTARTEDQDVVRGLNTGADDFVTKPFSIDSLLARMRALLRRSDPVPERGQISFHDITMDLAAHRVQRNGRSVHLGPTKYRLLAFFMQYPGRVFTREELLDTVWGPDIHVELCTDRRAYPAASQDDQWAQRT